MIAKRRKTVGLRSRLVLLVESHDDTREMYAESLHFAGFRVATATNGIDGMEKARELQPDIIATDLGLHGEINGFAMCEHLKSVALTNQIPVIAVTGLATPNEIAHARRVGCDAVLVKPCLPDTLLLEIQHLLKLRPKKPSTD
jgi:two-component system, cell cycle response regulator DivK